MSPRTTIRRVGGAAGVAVWVALMLAGCGSGSEGPVKVSINGYAFHPATITVGVGTKVTFTNHDQTAHTATASGSGFDTGTVKPGHSATITLRRPGTYAYVCQFHAFMHGTIIVRRG